MRFNRCQINQCCTKNRIELLRIISNYCELLVIGEIHYIHADSSNQFGQKEFIDVTEMIVKVGREDFHALMGVKRELLLR